jgi:hypothetical protein
VRRWRVVVVLLALLAVLGAGGAWWRLRPLAQVGAGYVAKQMCSCVFVAERSFESCRSDMLPSLHRVRAERLPGGAGVRAFLPLLADRTARFHGATGCTLE